MSFDQYCRPLLLCVLGASLTAAHAEESDSIDTPLRPETVMAAMVCPENRVESDSLRGYSVLMPLGEGITLDVSAVMLDSLDATEYVESVPAIIPTLTSPKGLPLYFRPYSMTLNDPDWGRYWANMGLLGGAMTGALLVLECLPEDATTWNRAELRQTPPFTRWYRNIFVRDPELDHDNWVFNYLLHPYAGAAYFMAARSVGFNFWRSFLSCFMVSTVFWEFGIEAFTERPSYQDIVITPVIGSIIGELFYKLKRDIVAHNYHLFGSRFLGGFVAFLIDPVNEFLDLFRGSRTKGYYLDFDTALKMPDISSTLMPTVSGGHVGFALSVNF